MKHTCLVTILLATILVSFVAADRHKPTFYLIGDSTVDNGSGNKGLWGWGKFLAQFFDTTEVSIRNYSQGGTSARTFYTGGIWDKKINKRGMWDTVLAAMQKDDYLLIQFGLNDQGTVDDTSRARGTLKGIGDDSLAIFNRVTNKAEIVHSFGWYLREYIKAAKQKGVTVFICTSVPRNEWKEGKLIRGEFGFAGWAAEVAQQENVALIDLNNMIADAYDKEGPQTVTQKYHIETDKIHTTADGATLNASLVAKAIGNIKKCRLHKFVL